MQDLDILRERGVVAKTQHKEEQIGRINADEKDRKKLCNFLKTCVHPLDTEAHDASLGLFNIFTGVSSPKNVNINKAVEIGKCRVLYKNYLVVFVKKIKNQ